MLCISIIISNFMHVFTYRIDGSADSNILWVHLEIGAYGLERMIY